MVARANYHTHCRYDDGTDEPEAYVRAALELGMRYLGFSAHAPVPFDNDWLMDEADLPAYLAEVRHLRDRYAGRITVFLGLEVDYLPGVITPRSPHILELGLDYTVGSVHFLARHPDGRYWTVDHDHEETSGGIRASFEGDVEAAVREYYGRIAGMALRARPDIIGHLDIVKKHNADRSGSCLFSEDTAWYREAVGTALDAVAQSGSIVEVNTRGLCRGITREPYPSAWILRECRRRSIPAMISSDAHQPEDLATGYDEASRVLGNAGYSSHMLLTPEGWQEEPL